MITEAEKQARLEAVEYAKASVGLEGVILSETLLDMADKYIQGILTREEFTQKYIITIRSESEHSENEIKDKLSFIRLSELRENPIKSNFNLSHLKEINAYIFQDTPTVAGNFRAEVEINHNELWHKNRNYPRFGVITVCYSPMGNKSIKEAEEILNAINIEEMKRLSQSEFAKVLTNIYKKLDYFHPFPDGNSRTLREFTRILSKEVGFKLDWTKNNRYEIYLARDLEVNSITLSKSSEQNQKYFLEDEIEAILKHPQYKSLEQIINEALSPIL